MLNQIEDFVRPTQKELFSTLCKIFGKRAISKKNGYILVPGDAPIMLVAHLDTVHKERVKHICKSPDGNILMSPQGIGGDDRCGVYALMTIHKICHQKPWLLFTCDEEIGCVGAGIFCEQYHKGKLPKELETLKCLVEIDRRGEKDAVYYDCANIEFEEYITSKGFVTDIGSCSDISDIAPALGVAAVNLSSGYYNAHTQHEYINLKQLKATIKKVVEIVNESVEETFPKYEFIEEVWEPRGYFGRDYYGSSSWCVPEFDEKILQQVPAYIRDEYEELLDYYTPEELDEYIESYGPEIIKTLYDSEIGYFYGGLTEKEKEDGQE